MSIEGLISSNIYRQYKAYVFVKDWALAFVVVVTFLYGMTAFVFLCGSFADGNWVDWDYFMERKWWYLRFDILISFIGSFLFTVYIFPGSYKNTMDKIKEEK